MCLAVFLQEFPLGDRSEDADMRLKHVTEITILTVQLIVEFSKRLPGFDTLLREDQITLLKVRFVLVQPVVIVDAQKCSLFEFHTGFILEIVRFVVLLLRCRPILI